MKKRSILTSILILIAGVAVMVLLLIFRPRQYNVIQKPERKGTAYWDLPTGSRIAYYKATASGHKKPHPVIYLHGGPGAGITDLEVNVLGKLAEEGYDVYLYDQVGCGRSERLDDITEYSAIRHREDLNHIIGKTGAQKAILVGQSWGSILALLYIARYPAKIDRFIVTSPGNIQPPNHRLADLQPPKPLQFIKPYNSNRYDLISTNLRARTAILTVKKFGRKFIPDEEADQLLTHLTTEINKTMVCDTANAVIAEGTEGFYSHYMTIRSLSGLEDPREKIKKSGIPLYLMKGECDNQKWGYTAEYLSLFSRHQLKIIKGAGHNAFIEQPAAYLEAIRSFLRD